MTCVTISLSEIHDNAFYRISRPSIPSELSSSIAVCGILEPVIVIKEKNHYIMVTGHRRIHAARSAGIAECLAEVWDSFKPDRFFEESVKKVFCKSAGSIGRLRAFHILSQYQTPRFSDDVKRAALHISKDCSFDDIKEVLSLDAALLDYLDEKDAPVKFLKKITLFSHDMRIFLKRCVEKPFRFSAFKMVCDMIDAISRGANGAAVLSQLIDSIAGMESDDDVLSALRKIRFPNIEQHKIHADVIVRRYKQYGADLFIPQYEEGKACSVTIPVKWADQGASYKKTLEQLLKEDISSVTKFL